MLGAKAHFSTGSGSWHLASTLSLASCCALCCLGARSFVGPLQAPSPWPRPPTPAPLSHNQGSAAVRWGEVDAGRAVGPLCGACKDTWFSGYNYWTVDELIGKCSAEGVRDAFLRVRGLLKDKAVPGVRLSDVVQSSSISARLVKRYSAYTRSGFEKAFGKEPGALGVRPVEMKDEMGDTYQAFLVDDDLPRVLELSTDSTCLFAEYLQHTTTSAYPDQASLTFRAATTEPKTSWLRKVRKAKTLSALDDAKSRLLADQAAEEQEALSDFESGVGSDIGEAGDDDAANPLPPVEDSTAGPLGLQASPMPSAAPSGSTKSAAASMAGGAMSSLPSLASPGKRAMTTASAMTVAAFPAGIRVAPPPSVETTPDRQGPARTLEAHFQRLALPPILSGAKKPGPERRWAIKFYDENHLTDVGCELLKSHIDCVDAAVAISGTNCHRLQDRQLQAHIELLKNQGVDFPTVLKRELLERRLAMWLQATDRFAPHRIDEMLDFLVPWSPISISGFRTPPVPEPYDPAAPRFASIEGSVQEKARDFRATFMKRVVAPGVREGEQSSDAMRVLLTKTVQVCEEADHIDEGYGDVLGETLRLSRLLIAILDGFLDLGATEHDVEWFRGQAGGRNTEKPAVILAAIVDQTPWWSEKFKILGRFGVANAMHASRVASAKHALEASFASANLLSQLKACFEAMQTIRALDGKVSPNIMTDMVKLVDDSNWKVLQSVSEQLDDNLPLPAPGEEVEAFVALAGDIFGPNARRDDFLAKVRVAKDATAIAGRLKLLGDLVGIASEGLQHFKVVEPQIFDSLASVLREGIAVDPVACPKVKDFLQSLVSVTLDSASIAHDDLHRHAELVHAMSAWAPDEFVVGEAKVEQFIVAKVVQAAATLSGRVHATQALMDDPHSTISDDQVTELLTAKASLATLCDGPRFGSSPALLPSLLQCAASVEKKLWEKFQAKAKADAETAGKSLEPLAGGGEDGAVWHVALDRGASLWAVRRQAETTILTRKGGELNKELWKTKALAERFVFVHALFGKPLEPDEFPDWFQALVDKCHLATATMASGLMMLQLTTHATNMFKLKGLIRAQRNVLLTPWLGKTAQGLLPSALWEASELASVMKFSWPPPS